MAPDPIVFTEKIVRSFLRHQVTAHPFAVDELITEGVYHVHIRHWIPAEISHLHGYQEEAIRAGRMTLVSTGTGISFRMYVGETLETSGPAARCSSTSRCRREPSRPCAGPRMDGQPTRR